MQKKYNAIKSGIVRGIGQSLFPAAVTFVVVVFAFILMVLANTLFPFSQTECSAAGLYDLNFAREFLGLAVLGFSIFLLYTYVKSYFEVKSGFTLGLAVAVLSFMLFALTSSPWFQKLVGVGADRGLTVIPMFFAMAGLAIMAWMSAK